MAQAAANATLPPAPHGVACAPPAPHETLSAPMPFIPSILRSITVGLTYFLFSIIHSFPSGAARINTGVNRQTLNLLLFFHNPKLSRVLRETRKSRPPPSFPLSFSIYYIHEPDG